MCFIATVSASLYDSVFLSSSFSFFSLFSLFLVSCFHHPRGFCFLLFVLKLSLYSSLSILLYVFFFLVPCSLFFILFRSFFLAGSSFSVASSVSSFIQVLRVLTLSPFLFRPSFSVFFPSLFYSSFSIPGSIFFPLHFSLSCFVLCFKRYFFVSLSPSHFSVFILYFLFLVLAYSSFFLSSFSPHFLFLVFSFSSSSRPLFRSLFSLPGSSSLAVPTPFFPNFPRSLIFRHFLSLFRYFLLFCPFSLSFYLLL